MSAAAAGRTTIPSLDAYPLRNTLAWSCPVFLFFRVIGELALGASSVMEPAYIAAVAPKTARGRLAGILQTILSAYGTNSRLALKRQRGLRREFLFQSRYRKPIFLTLSMGPAPRTTSHGHDDLRHQSLGSFIHWFMNALMSAAFPIVAARPGAVLLAVFAALMQFLVFLEVRGVGLQKMERYL